MADEFFDKLGDLLKKKPWYELPRLLADGRLVQMRTEMRKKNLHDTEEPAEPRQEIPANLDPRSPESAIRRRHVQRSQLPKDGLRGPPLRAQLSARAYVPRYARSC